MEAGDDAQRWDEMDHEVDYTPWQYPAAMLDSNYCRTPDLDLREPTMVGPPWCYTGRYITQLKTCQDKPKTRGTIPRALSRVLSLPGVEPCARVQSANQ